jgi:deoxyribose-phosphate aldolase
VSDGVRELASRIDHANLRPEATSPEVHRLVAEAMEHGFGAVCVAPVWVSKTAIMLRGSGVRVCTVISFPHGDSKATIKAIEATSSIKDGAEEIDVVAHLPNLMKADVDSARVELMEIVRAARATRRDVVIKVIIESAVLLKLGADRGEAAIAAACRAVRESGCDFVKTSTGFHPAGGASVEAVKIIGKYAEGLHIKASGGIGDLAGARAMLEAGADRLGMSNSVAILQEQAKME